MRDHTGAPGAGSKNAHLTGAHPDTAAAGHAAPGLVKQQLRLHTRFTRTRDAHHKYIFHAKHFDEIIEKSR